MATRNIGSMTSASLRKLFYGDDTAKEKENVNNKSEKVSDVCDSEETSENLDLVNKQSSNSQEYLESINYHHNTTDSFAEEHSNELQEFPTPNTPNMQKNNANKDLQVILEKDEDEVASDKDIYDAQNISDTLSAHGYNIDTMIKEIDPASVFSQSDDISEIHDLDILKMKELKEASFIGETEKLLTNVFETENTYKKTLPVYAYGVTKEVLSMSAGHEIICIDGKEFLSSTETILDQERFDRLVKSIELQLATGPAYAEPLCQRQVVTVNGEYFIIPVLIVNTYEFNVLRKTFEAVANVSLYVFNNHVTYLKVSRI